MRGRIAALFVTLGVAAVAACGGGAEPLPDVIERKTTSPGEIDPIVAEEDVFHVDPDGGPGQQGVDGNCCVVPFALSQEEGEAAAALLIHAKRYAMGVADGGGWYVDACVALVSDEYRFEVALPTDDDAGVLWVERTNSAVPTSTSATSPSSVNLFEVPDGGTCETFDGGRYAALPDGGS